MMDSKVTEVSINILKYIQDHSEHLHLLPLSIFYQISVILFSNIIQTWGIARRVGLDLIYNTEPKLLMLLMQT